MIGCLILSLVAGRARGGQVDFVLRGESPGSNCFGKFVVSCPARAIALPNSKPLATGLTRTVS